MTRAHARVTGRALRPPGLTAALIAAGVAVGASPARAQFKDQLVQAPRLAAPERGSVTGALAGIGFTASELARGAFRLPLPIRLPQERGPLQVQLAPVYSPDGGISEWGMGWSVDLSIRRHRLVGEIDYAGDDLLSPWGRLRPGNDANQYPTGLAAPVRVAASGSDWIATTSDGTQYTFTAAAGVTTPDGTYSWQLTSVVGVEGDRTTLEWTRNPSGRPFLSRATWGGRNAPPQYELVASYELLATPFPDRTTGTALDRRITGLAVSARDPVSGALRERWHYQLGYRAAPFGPAFYLETVQRTFAGGATEPALVYRYELDDARLPGAALEHYTGLDSVLQALGDTSLQADHAALQDVEADDQPDFEHAAALTQIQHTDAGWTQAALPPTTGDDPRCRPAASGSNQPRVLARLTPEVGAPHVLVTRKISTAPVTSTVLVCDRLGHPLADLVAPDDWTLGPNTRLVDVDRDRRPDLVRVSRAGVDVLHNDSDEHGFRFTPLPRFTWPIDITPKVTWLNDFDGDGNVDIAIRASTGLWILFGLGHNRWTTTPQLFRFVTLAGPPLGSLDAFQLTFIDANKDGLADAVLTKGITAFLFTNRGDSFAEVPVDGFRSVQSGFGLPIVADVTGRGNTEVVFPTLGTAYVVELALPQTGLLASADDGMGTVARFHYARSAPRPGIERRITLLDQLTVESSGHDAVTYGYSYGAPVLHTLGKQLLGFDRVIRRAPVLTETVDFLNDDDVAGITRLSEALDDRSPGIVRFTQQRYDDATFHGVRWLRPASVETGHRTPDGLITLSTTTRYTTYERERCPTVTVTSGPSGQLVSTTALASVAAIPDDLGCLPASHGLAGTHPDPSLDFAYTVGLDRNDAGQVTRVTQYGASVDLLVLQDIAYDADHRLRSATVPGRGTTLASFDAQGRLAALTDPTGTATRVDAYDPTTDAVRELTTARPLAASTSSFRYDGRERLQLAWDDFSGASQALPVTAYTYQDATGTTPGRIDTRSLTDPITGTSRAEVELLAADGKTLVKGTWVGDQYALGPASIDVRAALTARSSFVGPITSAALAALTSADLRARGTVLAETVDAGFGHEAQVTRTLQAGVVGTTTSELLLAADELVTRVHHPGGFVAESAVDAAGRLVRNTDENGVTHRYAYDALGRVVHIDTPDGGHALRFDGFGRPASVTRDGIGAITYAYDPVTGLEIRKQRLDTAGAVVETSDTRHDALGRTIEVSLTGAQHASELRFDYDGQLDGATVAGQLGRLTRVRGDGWQRSTLFDPLGRAYEQHTALTGWRDVASEKAYRPDGTVASETLTIRDAGGGVRLTTTQETVLDAAGRVSQLKVDGAVLYTLTYDPEGRLARASFASGETIAFDFDPVTHQRRGHQITAASSSGGVHWTLDPRGLVATETYDHGATTTRRDYSYDARGSLTQATTGDQIASYAYRPSGLIESIRDAAGSRSLRRSPGAISGDAGPYTWDRAGRVIGKDGWSFEYGGNGQIARATRPGRVIDYAYDEGDSRLLKRVDGVPVRAEVASGVLTEDHFIELVVVGGVVAGVLDNGGFTALLTDPRGTPFVGPDGTPGFASPYGVRSSHLGLADTIDYTRLGWDPDLDVIRMGVRDYDPRTGQFLTPDPVYLESLEKCQSSPLQCSLYAYAGGNPVNFVDPLGTDWMDWVAGVCGAVTGGLDAVTFGHYSKWAFTEEQIQEWNTIGYYRAGHIGGEMVTSAALMATGVGELNAALKAGQAGMRVMELTNGARVLVMGEATVQATVGATKAAWGTTAMAMAIADLKSGGPASKPGEALDPGERPVYRGGKDMKVKKGEVKLNAEGQVETSHGVSLNTNPAKLEKWGPQRIKRIPDELQIIQRGKDMEHFEIVPRKPMEPEVFQQLLKQVEFAE